MDALLHRPFPCSSRGEGSPSNRGTYIFGYYDLAHGNPISDTDTDSDLWGGLEGQSPSISAQPSGQGKGAATDDAQPLHRGREPPKANGRDGVGGEPSAGPHATLDFCRGRGKSTAKCALPLVVTSSTSEPPGRGWCHL